jgi:hypothetical protein
MFDGRKGQKGLKGRKGQEALFTHAAAQDFA